MWFKRVLILVLVILFTFVSFLKAYKYKAILEDDEIFGKCEDQPINVLDANGLFDMSELIIKTDFYKVTVSGNATLVWDIQLTDRIEGNMQLLKFDRGSWQPTIYSISFKNFCPSMYDKNQRWYQSWLKYVTNFEEVKDKCFNVPGTKFIHTPFDLEFIFESHLNMIGHYKLEVTLKAFDMMNKIRPTSICSTIRWELERL